MPTSKGRKKKTSDRARGRHTTRARVPRSAASGVPPVDGLVRSVIDGGSDLLAVEDPLDAEMWASAILGTFYKLPLPLDARSELERSIGPAIVDAAERRGNERGLAILRALAAVADDELAKAARDAADRLAVTGVPDPAWASEIGTAELVDAWSLADPYDDQVSYQATFRYPGRDPHTVIALYDENLGGIIKDALAGPAPETDPRAQAEREPGVNVEDVDPGLMAARIVHAVENGDLYLDNEWTEEFKLTRALLLARMRSLPAISLPEPAPPLEDEAREALTAEFLGSDSARGLDAEDATRVVGHCLDARCDYGDGDPLRWSPIVVETFLLDFLPRKAILDAREIRAMPSVLRAWVRFALAERGLEERWIAQSEEAVDRFAAEFRRAVTDPSSFGPAKAVTNAMLADGVDLRDQEAMNAWLAAFNARPIEERDELLGPSPFPIDPD